MAKSVGNLIRQLGDRAISTMTREELEELAMFDAHSEGLAFNLARLADGLGCLISEDASDDKSQSGALQGVDAVFAFAAIGDAVDIIGAVGYVSHYAALKLLRPDTYGAPVEGKKHA